MSHVKVEADDGERKEPFFLLFPGLLVMLSITPRLSGYVFEVSQSNLIYGWLCSRLVSPVS